MWEFKAGSWEEGGWATVHATEDGRVGKLGTSHKVLLCLRDNSSSHNLEGMGERSDQTAGGHVKVGWPCSLQSEKFNVICTFFHCDKIYVK